MTQVPIRFIVGELSEQDVKALEDDQTIISKMILSQEDFSLFKYEEGDTIQVESEDGNRKWCRIQTLETISDGSFVVIILNLRKHDR